MIDSIVVFFFLIIVLLHLSFFFFFNDTATTEIYTLSLHDALPILDGFGIIACGQIQLSQQLMRGGKLRFAGGDLLQSRSEEHTSELQSQSNLVCRLLLEKKKKNNNLSPNRTHRHSQTTHTTASFQS